MTVGIRPYAALDYESCRALWVELTERHRLIYADPSIGGDDPGAAFDDYLARPDRVGTWVFEEDGDVLGFTGLLVADEGGEVEPVVVTQTRRSQGLGRRLVEFAIAAARDRGLKYVGIRPVARNIEAIALFHEIGFRSVGHLDLFIDFADRGFASGPTLRIHEREYSY